MTFSGVASIRAYVIGTFLAGISVYACTPTSPESVLNRSGAPLQAPLVNFEYELSEQPILSPPPPVALAHSRTPAVNASDEAYSNSGLLNTEVEELKTILRETPAAEQTALIRTYTKLRAAMLEKYPTASFERPFQQLKPEDYTLFSEAELGRWPEGLPLDITLYLQGALQYHYGKPDNAIAIWKQLLELPPDQRRNRSTWAAWMIARTLRDQSGMAAAAPWFERCAELSAEGYRDPLNLGLSSLGWLARGELDRGNRRRALELYYHQALAGDPSGWSSLRQSLPDVSATSNDQLDEWMRDPLMRGLITASLLEQSFRWAAYEQGGKSENAAARWLASMERTQLKPIAEAGAFAELAYSSGQFDLARRWIERAPSTNARSLWVRAKLALMEGRTAEAETHLKAAESAFPRKLNQYHPIYSDNWLSQIPAEQIAAYRVSQFYGDLGATYLSSRHYPEALTAFLKGSFQEDANYLAERVLTRQELLTYVQREFPEPTGALIAHYAQFQPDRPTGYIMRYLAAKRLAREYDFANARKLYPDEFRPIFDRYVEWVKTGHQPIRFNREQRAAALWEAAQTHRALGMELFGTEGAPDSAVTGGNYPDRAFTESRFGLDFSQPNDLSIYPKVAVVPAPTRDELRRVQRSRLPIEQRYQYRYMAANLAGKAAALMPNSSDETARVLGIAGSWVKYENPDFADRFYKAMVWRNWETPLGREARERRWFPPLNWQYDPYAAANVPRPPNH